MHSEARGSGEASTSAAAGWALLFIIAFILLVAGWNELRGPLRRALQSVTQRYIQSTDKLYQDEHVHNYYLSGV